MVYNRECSVSSMLWFCFQFELELKRNILKNGVKHQSINQLECVCDLLQDFLLQKLDWPREYTEEKVLPLITLWDMTDILLTGQHKPALHLVPHRSVLKHSHCQSSDAFSFEYKRVEIQSYNILVTFICPVTLLFCGNMWRGWGGWGGAVL